MRLLLLPIILLVNSGCNEDKKLIEPIIINACYEKFIGNYRVFNSDSGNYYNMKIRHFKSVNDFGVDVDSLNIENFANSFNLKTVFYCTVDSNGDENYLGIGAHDSTYDYMGHRWDLLTIFQDSTGNKFNWLHNDTLNIYFRMCNIKYYIYDSQAYYCQNVLHIAVKEP